ELAQHFTRGHRGNHMQRRLGHSTPHRAAKAPRAGPMLARYSARHSTHRALPPSTPSRESRIRLERVANADHHIVVEGAITEVRVEFERAAADEQFGAVCDLRLEPQRRRLSCTPLP